MSIDNFKGYFNLQLYVLANDNLDLVESVIYCYFLSFHHAKKDIFVSNDFLCKIAKCNKRKIIYALDKLEKLGYIQRIITKRTERLIKIIDKDLASYANNHAIKTKDEICTGVHDVHGGVHNMHGGGAPNAPYNKDHNKDYKDIVITPKMPSQTTIIPVANAPESKPSKIRQTEDTIEYAEKWNDFIEQIKQNGDKTILKKINITKGETDVLKKLTKTIALIATLWPQLNAQNDYKLAEEIRLTPKSFKTFLIAAYGAKWHMLFKPNYPNSMDIILRKNNFETALLIIKAAQEE